MRISASHLKMLEHCAWPFRDDIEKPPKEKWTGKADAGKAVHRLFEWHLRGELGTTRYFQDSIVEFKVRGAEVSRVAAMFDRLVEWWVAEGRPAFSPEVAFEYDTNRRTARPLHGVSERDYPDLPGCVYGTADCVLVSPEMNWIADIKTGDPRYVDRTRVNHQMRMLSACLRSVYGVDSVRATLLFVDESGVTPDDAEYDFFDLCGFEDWMCSVVPTVATAEPKPGGHCRDLFCKYRQRAGYPGCPGWRPSEEVA